MNALERRTWTTLGWPRAGAVVVGHDGVSRIPIDCGGGQVIWLSQPAWGRQLITALTAAVNQLEALDQPGPDPDSGPEPQTDATAVLDAVADEQPHIPTPAPAVPPSDGDVLVHPTPAEETANA